MTSRSPEFAIFFLVLFLSSGCGSLRATPAHSRSLVYHRMMMPLEPLRMSMKKKSKLPKEEEFFEDFPRAELNETGGAAFTYARGDLIIN